MNILIRGEVFSRNELGFHCRNVIRDLKDREDINLHLINTSGSESGWIFEDDEEREYLDSLLKETSRYIRENRTSDIFDLSIQVQHPHEWEKLVNNNIGFFIGSPANTLPESWNDCINKMDRILVLSEGYREQLPKNTDAVVYHSFASFEEEGLPSGVEESISDFNFLLDAKWHPENDIEKVIVAFVQEFMNEDLGLILRTSVRNYSEIDRHHTYDYIKSLSSMMPQDRKCKIHLVHGLMNRNQEMNFILSSKIGSYINCSHSLATDHKSLFAWRNGKSVISASTGIFKELPEDSYYKVDSNLSNLNDRHVTNNYLTTQHEWCYLDLMDLRNNMRKSYSDFFNNEKTKKCEKNIEQDKDMLYNIIKKQELMENKDETK